jgi:hypothetical protein
VKRGPEPRALRETRLAKSPSAAHIDGMESGPSEIAISRWLAVYYVYGTLVFAGIVGLVFACLVALDQVLG